MNKLINTFIHMNDLDDFAMGDTFLHCFHPLFKIILCLIILIFTLTASNLLELIVYTIIIMFLSYKAEIPFIRVIKRGMLGLPFCLCIGISNIILSRDLMTFYGFTLTTGIYSCLLILMKTFLCLSATYLLIATSSFNDLSSELIRMKVPSIFVLQLTMTYRYIFTFLEEAKTMAEAYALRNPNMKGIAMKDMGSFVGHLLVKSMLQSKRVYECMLCRGFNVKRTYTHTTPINFEHFYLSLMFVSVLIIIKGVF